MELVYLWVEDYKNIQKQGFNFSPRFRCKYDEASKELTIDENKDCLENFFGENINVTAIVGENGSGKSSLLEKLYLNKTLKYNDMVIILMNNEIIICCQNNLQIINNTKYIYRLMQNTEILDLSYMNISHFHTEDIDIFENNYISVYQDIMYSFEEENSSTNKSSILKRYKNFKTQLNYYLIYYNSIFDFLEKKLKINKPYFLQLNFLKNSHIKDFFEDNREDLDINTILYTILSNSDTEEFENENDKFDINRLNNFINSYDSDNQQIIDNLIDNSEIVQDSIVINMKNIELIKEFINIVIDNDKLEYFELTYLTKDKKRIDLSSGEQLMLFYLYNIENSNNILVIDEVDLYLHPNWQKSFLSLIIDNIKKNKHIILSSHSPFILSDLPKENVIFLKDGKQVDVNINPFGANIHTLLSHGFFMKDGLMGEFAKGKIEDVINYLNDKESTIKNNDEAQKLLNIIGEPVIKNQLQRMLDSKRLSKVDEIDKIKLDMKNLAKRLEELEK